MKRLSLLALTLLLALSLGGCGLLSSWLIDYDDSDGYAFEPLVYGYVDAAGQWVLRPEQLGYTYEFSDISFYDGRALYYNGDDLWGYIDKTGQPVIQATYDFACPFHNGAAWVSKGNNWHRIDRDGNTLATLERGSDLFTQDCSQPLLSIYSDGKLGFITPEGKMAVKPTYDETTSFVDGYALVGIRQPGGALKWGCIDESGQLVKPVTLDLGEDYIDLTKPHGFVVASESDSELLYYNTKGERIYPDNASPDNFWVDPAPLTFFTDGITCRTAYDYRYVLRDRDGKQLFESRFMKLSVLSPTLMAADELLLDNTGKQVGRLPEGYTVLPEAKLGDGLIPVCDDELNSRP